MNVDDLFDGDKVLTSPLVRELRQRFEAVPPDEVFDQELAPGTDLHAWEEEL